MLKPWQAFYSSVCVTGWRWEVSHAFTFPFTKSSCCISRVKSLKPTIRWYHRIASTDHRSLYGLLKNYSGVFNVSSTPEIWTQIIYSIFFLSHIYICLTTVPTTKFSPWFREVISHIFIRFDEITLISKYSPLLVNKLAGLTCIETYIRASETELYKGEDFLRVSFASCEKACLAREGLLIYRSPLEDKRSSLDW